MYSLWTHLGQYQATSPMDWWLTGFYLANTHSRYFTTNAHYVIHFWYKIKAFWHNIASLCLYNYSEVFREPRCTSYTCGRQFYAVNKGLHYIGHCILYMTFPEESTCYFIQHSKMDCSAVTWHYGLLSAQSAVRPMTLSAWFTQVQLPWQSVLVVRVLPSLCVLFTFSYF